MSIFEPGMLVQFEKDIYEKEVPWGFEFEMFVNLVQTHPRRPCPAIKLKGKIGIIIRELCYEEYTKFWGKKRTKKEIKKHTWYIILIEDKKCLVHKRYIEKYGSPRI